MITTTCCRVPFVSRMVKLTTAYLMIFTLVCYGKVHAQLVSLNVKDAKFQDVALAIQKQTGYSFTMNKQYLDLAAPVTMNIKQAGTDEAFEKLFRSQPFTYTIKGKVVALVAEPAKSDRTPNKPKIEQQQSVQGRVLDQSGQALTGASIRVVDAEGKTTGSQTQTDAQGRFTIGVQSFPISLSISFIGHKSEVLQITAATSNLNVTLIDDNALNEVLVVGYGTTTRLKNTGSVGKVSGETIVKQPINNPVLAMQGRIPGVFVTSTSGNLGSDINVRIRGTNTIASSGAPLYIIDGVPLPTAGLNSFEYGGATGSYSPFTNINSADIESMEVLKDADATAIYGSRGANGVVLITTKKGKGGPTRVSADVYKGIQDVAKKLDMLNTQEYIQMRRDAFAADNITSPTMGNAVDLLLWGNERYTDFQELLFGETGQVTDAQFNVQSGNKNTQFLVGLGYREEDGVIMGKNNQRRGTARINVNHISTNNKFLINSSVSYTALKTAAIVTDAMAYTWTSPNLPLTDEVTGGAYFYGTDPNAESPLKYLHTDAAISNYNFIGAATIGYNILSNLQVKVDASYTRLDYQGVEKYKDGYLNPNEDYYENSTNFGSDYQHTYNIEPQVNYRQKIGTGQLTALLGGTLQETIGGGQFVQANAFSAEQLMGDLSAASSLSRYRNDYNQYKFNSVFGRLTYDLQDKYILNATFRRDGSSRFGPNKQFGNFWAVGAAWIASNETFFKDNLSFMSLAKLRSSYGLTGNDRIGNYQYMETYAATIPYNYRAGLFANRLGNPEFGWETNRKFEVAAELNFFNNRITTTSAFFNNISGNQLVSYPIAGQTGWTSYVANLDAKIRNRGFEFDLNTLNIDGKNFKWRTNFNITTFTNKLLDFPNLAQTAYAGTYEIGKSVNLYRRYEYIGIDPKDGAPLVKDQDGNGTFTSALDYISHGNSDAKFYGGLGNTLSYKGIDLDIFFQFTKRPYAPSYIWSTNTEQPGGMYNVPEFLLEDIWQKVGDEASKPKLSTRSSGAFYNAYNRYVNSTGALEDASYIRLKNLSLSYTLPTSVINKLKVHKIRLYVLGQNLWTITGYQGFDPETFGDTVPPLRIFTFGLNVTF